MFQKAELKDLQTRKDLLVLQSDTNRLLLTVEWRRLRTPETWMKGAGGVAGRHPLWAAALTVVTGVLTARILRKSAAVPGSGGWLGQLLPVALLIWKFLHREKSDE